MTRRQSNNLWSGGVAAHTRSNISECKNLLENFSPRLFGIKTASSSMIIFQRPEISMRSINHICRWNWKTFWRINATENLQMWSCSCTIMHRPTGHLHARRNWHTCASSVLNTQHIPRIWPRQTTTCSVDKINNCEVATFRATRRSLLPCRPR
jgi:hypothetical protein